MTSFFTLAILQSALELGVLYAIVSLALFVSYSILHIADLSTDGCFVLGCAVGAQLALAGHPLVALLAAMAAGVLSGFVTAFLQTVLKIESILAGIVVNTALYTINLAVMGFSSNLSLFQAGSLFTLAKNALQGTPLQPWHKLLCLAAILAAIALLLLAFLQTRLGLSIRATGDNADMVRASSINPAFTITVGLCLSGALTALAGALLGQYQKSCDINLGTGLVTVALASLMIGEAFLGRQSLVRRLLGALLGSVVYRLLVAVALRLSLPAEALKLVSAGIVAVAIAAPQLKKAAALHKRKRRKGGAVC